MYHLRNCALASLIASMLIAVTGCGSAGPDPTSNTQRRSGAVRVFTANYPLMYFAERIGGEQVEVVFPAPADVDPAYWSPVAQTISEYQAADLILLNGAGYSKWTRSATLPGSRLIDTTKRCKDRYISNDIGQSHSHGSGAEHSHVGIAATLWLDPLLAIEQAESIRLALSEARPNHDALFQRNFDSLKSDLVGLNNKFTTATAHLAGQPVVCSHPVFQYFARRYKLRSQSVHWEPHVSPTEDQWAELGELLKSHPAKWMIWEGEPLVESHERLSKMGVASVVVVPCGNRVASGDWLAVMNRNADELARAKSSDGR